MTSYVNYAYEGDVKEVDCNLTSKRPNIHLDASEDDFSSVTNPDEDCSPSKAESVQQSVGTSLETERCLDENVHTVGIISNSKLISHRKPFRQPSFPSTNDLFTRPSEI